MVPAAHRHAVDRPQLLPDGEHIQQGLGRMLPHTVPSIDHRLTAMTRRTLNTTEEDVLTKLLLLWEKEHLSNNLNFTLPFPFFFYI